MADRHYQPPYDPKLPPVRNPSGIRDATSSRFPVSPPVVSFAQPPHDPPRQPRETTDRPRRLSYDQGPRDTVSNNPRQPYNDPRPPPNPTSTRRPLDPQRSLDNTRQPPGTQQPPRDTAPISHHRQPRDAYDAQWPTDTSRQLPGTQQLPRDTSSISHQRQPRDAYDAQWPTDTSRQPPGTQRPPHTATTSHQRQPRDAFETQWPTPTGSNHREPHGTRQPQRDTASTSHQRQFSDPPRLPDGGGDSSYRGGARGMDLTDQVRVLLFPGKKYQWLIGAGASTDVFKGEYRQVMAPGMAEPRPVSVAVKILRLAWDDQQQREDVSKRLIRESSVWLRLDHPNILPYLGHCSDLGLSVALISPLCGNNTVLKYITTNPSANKIQLVKDVVKGLDYLHSKDVIHGDLQCNNVLVDEAGRAKLTDFGRAKVIGEVGYSTQMLAGSAAYMAPELFPLTDANVDNLFTKKSDVYAFGMLCFEIFTNQEPFASYNARQDWQVVPLIHKGKRPICTSHVQRQITKNDWAIMEACWTTVPANRPSTAQIIQKML